MGYEHTTKYLIKLIAEELGAVQVTMLNSEHNTRVAFRPKDNEFDKKNTPNNTADIIISLSLLPESILVFSPKKKLREKDNIALGHYCEQALQNALKYESALQCNTKDDLTGLLNKSAFQKRVVDEIAHCARRDGQFGLAFIDLDGFKGINDTYGHLKGDMVLQEVAEAFKKAFRQNDIIARFGGDEFVILFQDIGQNIEKILAHRISNILKQIETPLTASIGFAYYKQDGNDFESLIKTADKKMYSFKSQNQRKVRASID